MLHSERGKVREAATCFEQALALDPRHAAACLQLGDSLMDLHEYDRALAAYRHALTLRVPFPEAHNNLAGALLRLGDTHAAIAECRQALVERPGYVLALNTLGAALGKVGLLEEAIAVLRQAISLNHAYANAHHNLGNVLDQAGRVEEAKQAYHAALTINPTLEEARYNLAALGDMPPPPSTPYPYLLRLFDSYAPSFDQHLVEALDYVVPEKLYEAVLAARPGSGGIGRDRPGLWDRPGWPALSEGRRPTYRDRHFGPHDCNGPGAARSTISWYWATMSTIWAHARSRATWCWQPTYSSMPETWLQSFRPLPGCCVPAVSSPFPWKPPRKPIMSCSRIGAMPILLGISIDWPDKPDFHEVAVNSVKLRRKGRNTPQA